MQAVVLVVEPKVSWLYRALNEMCVCVCEHESTGVAQLPPVLFKKVNRSGVYQTRDIPQDNAVEALDTDSGARCPPSKLPSIPAADRIAQRTASMPSTRPGPIDVSALQVIISPKAPGPSETRGSG